MTATRRFPAPWKVEPTSSGFMVQDASGQALAYFYGDDDPGRAIAGDKLSMDEARRLAKGFARLPELMREEG